MLSVRPLAGAFGDCCCGGGCVGWLAWFGGVVFAAVVCELLLMPLLEAALLACPAALLVVELLGLLVLVAPLALLVPLAPFVPFVSLVPVVLFVLLLFVPFVPFVFCGSVGGWKTGSDGIEDILMTVFLADIGHISHVTRSLASP
jgi:hypothetical protein